MNRNETPEVAMRPAPRSCRPIGTILVSVFLALTTLELGKSGSSGQDGPSGTGTQRSPNLALRGDVRALGRLEPAAGLIIVGARPGTRIEKFEVQQGNLVKAGQVLAVLEGRDQARAQLALAEAQKAQVLHQRSIKKQTLTLERDQFDKIQKAKLDAASRVATLSNQRFEQNTKLYKTLGATLQGKDRLEADLRYFESELQNIKAKLEKDSLEIAQQAVLRQRKLEDDELGDKSPDLDVLDRQIDLARVSLAQTEVRATIGGRVLEIMARAGEVSSGPILAMADLSAVLATSEVDQSDILRLSLGDRASVQVLDRTLEGKVTRIGTIVGRNQMTSPDPRALQDRRVVKVSVNLDDPTLAARFINMEVDVTIRPGGTTAAYEPGKSGAG